MHLKCLHLAGRAVTSDWSVHSYIMVVYEKCFSCALDRIYWLNFQKTMKEKKGITYEGKIFIKIF